MFYPLSRFRVSYRVACVVLLFSEMSLGDKVILELKRKSSKET